MGFSVLAALEIVDNMTEYTADPPIVFVYDKKSRTGKSFPHFLQNKISI